jgi:hypothetical protein
MRYSFIFLLLFCLLSGNSQLKEVADDLNMQKVKAEIKDTTDIIICELPEPQINWEEWVNYLQDNLALDSVSLDTIKAGTYKVLVQFEIDQEGKVNNAKVIIDPGYGFGKRVADVISNYKSNGMPVEQNNHAVRSYRRQPVIFIIQEEEDCEEELHYELIL